MPLRSQDQIFAGDSVAVDRGIGLLQLVLYQQTELWKKQCKPELRCAGAIPIASQEKAKGFLPFELIKGYLDPKRPTPVVFSQARSMVIFSQERAFSVDTSPQPAVAGRAERIDMRTMLANVPTGRLTIRMAKQTGVPDPTSYEAEINWGAEMDAAFPGAAAGVYAVDVQRGGESLSDVSVLLIVEPDHLVEARDAYASARQIQMGWKKQEGVRADRAGDRNLFVQLFLALHERYSRAK